MLFTGRAMKEKKYPETKPDKENTQTLNNNNKQNT